MRLKMSTSKYYIFDLLRSKGVQCPKIHLASSYQLYMVYQCHQFYALYQEQFKSQDFDVNALTAPGSLQKIFETLFENGVTLGRITAMYIYGALFALEFLKCNESSAALLIPDWIDNFTLDFLKPRLLNENRWHCYQKLLHLM